MKLSKQSEKILEEIKNKSQATIKDLEKEGYDQSQVNRALLELEENGLVKVQEEIEIVNELSGKGKETIKKGSPEHRLLKQLNKHEEKNISEFQDIEIDIALGKAKQKNWVKIDQGKVTITQKGMENQGTDIVKNNLKEGNYRDEYLERGLVKETEKTEKTIKITSKGKNLEPEEIEIRFNPEAPAKTPRTGKRHFYKEIISYARKKWLEMGFQEMQGNYVSSGLLNFDSLFIPQDHPARELQDTFFMKNPEKSRLSSKEDEIAERVKQTHEDGWDTGSTGWQYQWEREETEKNVLRTHTTSVSAKKLSELNKEDLPKKYFTVSRAFRNETVDRTHLAEFYQTDGIVVGEDLNFKNLKGYISEFFEKMGYEEFRLIPSYYPYTEMSVEVQVWSEEDQEWMGMGGAGMFRPEVTKPLLGFEARVLAWGLGIPRIAMKAAGIKDIRELYRNDAELLEETSVWRPNHKKQQIEEEK